MTSDELVHLKVGNPADLIETVPYLMGFHPQESLILIGFTGGPPGQAQQVSVTMRADLDPDGLDLALLDPLMDAVLSSQTSAVVAVVMTEVVVGDPRAATWLAELADVLEAAMAELGVHVLDILVASETRWWSLCCDSDGCCPPAGSPRRLHDSPVAAEATYAGLVALPDRQALAATLDGLAPAERTALEPALAEAENRVTDAALRNGLDRFQALELVALIDAAGARRQSPLSPDQLARFGVALTDLEIRDALWVAIDRRGVEAGAFLAELHTKLPTPYDAPALFLYGWDQWRAGNGTLAAMAAERALSSDPDYSAADLLLAAIQHALDPHHTPPLPHASIFDRARRGA